MVLETQGYIGDVKGDLNTARLIIECRAPGAFSCAVLSEVLFSRKISVPKRKAKQIPEKKAMIAQLKSMGRCGQRVIDDRRPVTP